MYDYILWGTGRVFCQNIHMIRYHERCNEIKVVGVTSNTTVFSQIAGYTFVHKKDLRQLHFDAVIIMEENAIFQEIKEEAISLGIEEKKLISYRALRLPNFNFEKYKKIQNNPPTIFANNCWGGFTYHSLGLEFLSPLVNMFMLDEDYLRFLRSPSKYMKEKLVWEENGYNATDGIIYPICSCGDIRLYFNHDKSFESAKICWERRKARIQWDNLFVMMQTENEMIASEFAKLPYEKKVCFVPFPSENDSLIHIKFRHMKEMGEIPFEQVVNSMAMGAVPYYDVLDLMNERRITEISELWQS